MISLSQIFQTFMLKVGEDPAYRVVMSDTPEENGGLEMQAGFEIYRQGREGHQLSINIEGIKSMFPRGVLISRVDTPIWTGTGEGIIRCLCSVLPESSFKNEAQALPETQLPATSHREMYEMVGKYASLPQWDDMSISKQKVIKRQIDMLLLIAKM